MRRYVPAWLGVAAFALQALWPLIVQARAPRAALTISICSADGHGRALTLPDGQRSRACQLHCTLCAVGADRAALAPAPSAVSPAPARPLRAATAPATQDVPSRPDFFAHPRAPPALS